MDCDEFADRIERSGPEDERLTGHAEVCPDCALRLTRARRLVGLLSDLPRESLPAADAERIRRAVLATPPSRLRPSWIHPGLIYPAWAAAAAALLIAVTGTLALLSTRERYRPLDLKVIEFSANGARDEELVFEHIYGLEGGPYGDAANGSHVATDRR